MLRTIVTIVGMLAMLLSSSLMQAQDFSADIVDLKPSKNIAKIYVSKDRIRFEGADQSAGMGPTALIFDEGQNKRTILMTQRHMYMDLAAPMTPVWAVQVWRVADVNDACPQWKRASQQLKTSDKWGTCTKIGGDTLNGRNSIKYQAVSSEGEISYVWIDAKLQRVMKWETPSKSVEMRNIQEGTQPATLFEIPTGYTKFDMGMMQQRAPK